MAILEQSARIVVNKIMVLFNCTTVGQTLIRLDGDPVANLTLVGLCLMLVFGWTHLSST